MALKKLSIAVVNGPNLNLLGSREPEVYGKTTLKDIEKNLKVLASELGASLSFFQSNHEGEILDHIHSHKTTNGILINPAALTHTSIALRDAPSGVAKPVVEVHLSNVYAREEFRHHSYVSGIAIGVVSGFGALSYELGLKALVQYLRKK